MTFKDEKTGTVVTLSRTLGVWEVTLLGVGALLGGGIFTLLGHAAGLSGGGLIFSMILGSAIAFLNLNSYVSLSTTFPQAGGGYNWVRAGLGNLQGFLAGWFSFMASAVACSLYAVSFGIFLGELFFSFLNIPHIFFSENTWELIFAVGIIVTFGLVNQRGIGCTYRDVFIISLIILSILALYIFFGFKHLLEIPIGEITKNLNPFLPFGIAGVLQAAGLFYIAFEGSEIQAQSGEETKDPHRTLKIGLFSSWAIVSCIYFLIAIIIITATNNGGLPSWKILGMEGEHSIVASAKQFLPFGYLLMIIAGLLANIAALNATIYSSSRVLFAMARDNFIWHKLGKINAITHVPYLALVTSVVVIMCVAVLLPLKDIASAADLLFIFLFIQLNLAYIEMRRKRPDAKWRYIVPFGVVLPLTAVALYLLIGVSLFRVSPLAIYLTVIWLLLGLVNYLGYTKTQGEEFLEQEVKYEHTTRFRQKFGYRVILPIAEETHVNDLSEIAFAMTKTENGELFAVRIHEVPLSLPLDTRFNIEHERRILDQIEKRAIEAEFNIYTRFLAARSIPETILETVQMEDGDLLVMGWDGYVNTKGFIFGKKIDAVLHRVKCDLIVAKLKNPLIKVERIFIPVSIEDNPNLRFTGRVADALIQKFGSKVTIGMVIPEKMSLRDYANYKVILDRHLLELKIKNNTKLDTKIIRSNFIISSILKEAERFDLLLVPADRGRITRAIGMGSIPEQVAKHSKKTVLMTKGHRGIIQPFFDYIQSFF